MHLILLYALQYFHLFYVIIGASCISTHDMNPIIIKNERKKKKDPGTLCSAVRILEK